MYNRYPVYIISKGRHDRALTHRALRKMKVDHFIVVEESDRKNYEPLDATILVLPQEYIDAYDTCDDIDMPKGSGPARNFCIDHSHAAGFRRHWLMDDNIEDFNRLNKNLKPVVRTSKIFQAAEDFVERYSNVPLAGLNYYSFCKVTDAIPPYQLNTKIYSCMLFDNTSGFRWRARFNEDVDLSIRILKNGQCTILFNAFLCGKVTTQRMSGGNTDTIYVDGTLEKSKMLQRLHPDVAKVVWKFNRWHHQVDYSGFTTELKLINDLMPDVVDNFGMRLIKIENKNEY